MDTQEEQDHQQDVRLHDYFLIQSESNQLLEEKGTKFWPQLLKEVRVTGVTEFLTREQDHTRRTSSPSAESSVFLRRLQGRSRDYIIFIMYCNDFIP